MTKPTLRFLRETVKLEAEPTAEEQVFSLLRERQSEFAVEVRNPNFNHGSLRLRHGNQNYDIYVAESTLAWKQKECIPYIRVWVNLDNEPVFEMVASEAQAYFVDSEKDGLDTTKLESRNEISGVLGIYDAVIRLYDSVLTPSDLAEIIRDGKAIESSEAPEMQEV